MAGTASTKHCDIERAVRAAVAEAYRPRVNAEQDAFTVSEFCERHRISRTIFYEILKAGTGPTIFKCGAKTLVSKEAAARWRAEREAASSNCARKVAHEQ
jgi:hypothetical protein